MSAPVQKPGKSFQAYGTPDDLLAAVRKRFGPLSFDLAASADNTVVPGAYYDKEADSLSRSWHQIDGLLWLNPEFANIASWAEKCWLEAREGAKILMLTPASVGSEWFRQCVHGNAYVLALNPRLVFKGCTDAYPKDCMISVWGHGIHGFDVWRWK